MIYLTPIEQIAEPDRYQLLYSLLNERPEAYSISHKTMPSLAEHSCFVDHHPYEAWYFIVEVSGEAVLGSIALSRPPRPAVAGNEISIAIFAKHQRRGVAQFAVRALMSRHGPGRYLANIAPANAASIGLFTGLGFKHVQQTYEFQHDD